MGHQNNLYQNHLYNITYLIITEAQMNFVKANSIFPDSKCNPEIPLISGILNFILTFGTESSTKHLEKKTILIFFSKIVVQC